jgi:hypothetical protein
MKSYLNSGPGPLWSMAFWLLFVVIVVVIIGSAPSIDTVIWGR